MTSPPSSHLLNAPVVLICGGTSGIGSGLALQLATQCKTPTISIVGRNVQSAEDVLSKMKERNPTGTYSFIQKDLSLFSEIHALIEAIDTPVDVLVLSQGKLSFSRSKTREGFDDQLVTNNYGRFAVIELMRRKNLFKDGARVVSVFNSKNGDVEKMYWDDIGLEGPDVSIRRAIPHTMALNDIITAHFATLDRPKSIVHFHSYPGYVRTSIGRNLPWWAKLLFWPSGYLKSVSPEVCAERMLNAIMKEDITEEMRNYRDACLIDEMGKPIQRKKEATKDQIQKVADFIEEKAGLK